MKTTKLHSLFTCCLILISLISLDLSAQEIRLEFDHKGEFKIAQFTDTHFYKGGPRSPEVIENIRMVLETEKPDLVVLTGDIVTGSGKNWPTLESWNLLTDVFIEFQVPYAIAFGNHDDEAQVQRQHLLEHLSSRPYCLISDDGGKEIKGCGNYVLPVYNQHGEAEKLLYCMDSRSYSLARDKGIEGYGWFDPSQISWFSRTNWNWMEKYPDVQSLLFFHIPLPEYKQAFDDGEYRIGIRMEEECAPEINTGMFAALALQGNVLGTFVGHDHNNNYVAQLYKIALCYGYFSGGNSYGDLPLNGARIILLEEGKRNFRTWIRRIDGKELYRVKLPKQKKQSL